MIFQRTHGRAARTAGVALVLTAGLLMSGCGLLPSPSLPPVPTPSAAPAPSGSDGATQAEQCEQLMTDVRAIAVDVARVGELVTTDPLQAFGLLGGITERVGELEARVTDPALLERIDEIQTRWDALVEDAAASLQTLDQAGIERAITGMTELGDQVTALQEFCAGTA